MGAAKLISPKRPWQEQAVRLIPYIIGLGFLFILPNFLPSFLQNLAIKILIYAIFAMSLDLILGYTGLFSMGHAAFFGVGGYTAGIMMVKYGVTSFWIVAPMSILMSGVIAALFGYIALRVKGLRFLMVTLALGQLLFSLTSQWMDMTGGHYGLRGIPLPNLGIPGFSFDMIQARPLYYFVLVFFIISFFLLRRIIHSPFGQALQGIREDEPRMKALGYNTWLYKYLAFIITGMFAGLAGLLFAQWNLLISPMHVGFVMSTSAV
ncbi:branched-chain amino acid ABC transporter permease, partial [Chloroflexota bacterium]